MSDDIFSIMDSMDPKQNKSDDIFSALDSSGDNELMQMMSQKPKTSIAQDVYSGVSQIPSTVWEMAKEFPSEAYGAAKQAVTDPKRVGQNLLSGLAQMGHGVLNTPANIVDYLKQKEVLPDYIQAARQPEYDFAAMTGRQGQQPGDALISGTAEYLPYLLSAGVGAAGRGAFTNALRQAGASAVNAVGQNENPITAAGTMGIADLGLRGFGNALNRARNLKLGDLNPLKIPENIAAQFGEELNPRTASELAARLRAAEGTQTPLGDVLGSPLLKKTFENAIAPQWASGAEKIFPAIENQIRDRANSVAPSLESGALNEQLHGALNKKFKETTATKNQLYNEADSLAKSEGIELDLPSFRDYALENSEILQNSPLLKTDSKMRKIYNKLLDYKNDPKKAPSVAEANMLANSLSAEGNKMISPVNSATDRGIGRLYLGLRDNLKNDISQQISSKGSPELQGAYQKANDYYKNTYAKFLDKDVAKLLEIGKDPQNIVNEIIKPGKSADKFRAIEKINNILEPSQREMLGQAFLQKAAKNEFGYDPKSLNEHVNKLGERQFNALFPENARGNIQDFQNLLKMNSEAMGRLQNPKTGFRGANSLSGLLGAASGGAVGGALGGPIGAMAGVGASQGLARLLTRAATSEPFREAVVNRKLNNFQEALRNRNNMPLIDGRQNLLLEGLAGALVPPNNTNKALVSY